jgi:DNA-binding transcriptional ArsR family regulator
MCARKRVVAASHAQEQPSEAQIAAAVTTFQLLGDATRLRLMWALADGEHDVGTLAEMVGAARPAVSQHLAKLRLAGLVEARRMGRRGVYRARDAHVRALIAEALHHADHEVSGIPRHD